MALREGSGSKTQPVSVLHIQKLLIVLSLQYLSKHN